jgi:hypothetical protein
MQIHEKRGCPERSGHRYMQGNSDASDSNAGIDPRYRLSSGYGRDGKNLNKTREEKTERCEPGQETRCFINGVYMRQPYRRRPLSVSKMRLGARSAISNS